MLASDEEGWTKPLLSRRKPSLFQEKNCSASSLSCSDRCLTLQFYQLFCTVDAEDDSDGDGWEVDSNASEDSGQEGWVDVPKSDDEETTTGFINPEIEVCLPVISLLC